MERRVPMLRIFATLIIVLLLIAPQSFTFAQEDYVPSDDGTPTQVAEEPTEPVSEEPTDPATEAPNDEATEPVETEPAPEAPVLEETVPVVEEDEVGEEPAMSIMAIPVPELPVPPAVEACQISSAGRAYRDKEIGNDVTERTYYGDGPKVNIDSWGDNTRFWGNTRESLTDVTFTYTIKAGATFTGATNDYYTPAKGSPTYGGYTGSVDGFEIVSISSTQIVITVASMPAGSSWSMNAPIIWDGTEYYIDSTMVATQPDCEPTYSISGNIGYADQNNGGAWTVIEGADVCINDTDNCVTTDASGNFVFADMAPGEYWFTTTADGFKPNGNGATISDGDVTANLSLEQTKVSGQVGYTDANGNWQGSSTGEVCFQDSDRCTTVDANGNYAFYQVENGTHWLVANVDGFESINNSVTIENNDGTANFGLTLNVIADPGLPSKIEPAACQDSYAGYTVMTRNQGVTDRIKVGGDEEGEVNGDGWGQVGGDGWSGDGQTMRLYAATKHDLKNVTLTYTAVGGGDFGANYNSLATPGNGALQGNGYTVAASGVSISVDGNTISVTVAHMPANSSLSFNIPVTHHEGQPNMYVHSWMIGTQTNCDVTVPELPTPPVPEVCQQALSGRTITSGPTANVVERPKFGEGGEVNADGWGTTFRLYGATDEPIENVTATFTATQGFHFDGSYNSLSTPGGGNLQNSGYTVAADGITVNVTETTVTVTVASMPANSSWSFNVPIVVDIETGKLYMDSTMISDLVDCGEAELALPEINESVCDDNYQPTPTSVTAPQDTDAVSYSDVSAETGDDGTTYTITATANRGFSFEGVTLPEGWSFVNNSEVVFSVTLALADCEVPPTVVTPEVPTLVAATCDDDNSPVPPSLTVPEDTEGITYGEVQATTDDDGVVTLTLTATANEGFTFEGATLPEGGGWTLVNSSEAVFETTAVEADCSTPEPTETPDPTETPEPSVTPDPTEEPVDEKDEAPKVTELPTVGTGSNPGSMIGIAATAAAALASAGLIITNRKR